MPDTQGSASARLSPRKGMNVFDTRPLARDRYIDSFDYVAFINSLKDEQS